MEVVTEHNKNSCFDCLFLDDQEGRHEIFNELHGKNFYRIVHCVNFYDFCFAIKNIKFDFIFLDHDLGNKNDKNGIDCVKFLIENCKNKPSVICHSMNPVGNKNIINILKDNNFDCSSIPFMKLLSLDY